MSNVFFYNLKGGTVTETTYCKYSKEKKTQKLENEGVFFYLSI